MEKLRNFFLKSIPGIIIISISANYIYDYFVKENVSYYFLIMKNFAPQLNEKIIDTTFKIAPNDSSISFHIIVYCFILYYFIMKSFISITFKKEETDQLLKFLPFKTIFIAAYEKHKNMIPDAISIIKSFLYILLAFFLMTIFEILLNASLIKRDFERIISVISPFADQKLILELKSDFSQMETKSDFRAIKSKIENTANTYKIKIRWSDNIY